MLRNSRTLRVTAFQRRRNGIGRWPGFNSSAGCATAAVDMLHVVYRDTPAHPQQTPAVRLLIH